MTLTALPRAHAGTRANSGSAVPAGRCRRGRARFALRAVLARSLDDLAQLRGELDGLRYYEAGVPWFATLFGRDSLIAALQSLPWDPDVAAETLRLLARRQGQHEDSWRDEEPGKILHELRIGELARMGEIPQTPYYGTIDATPLFLIVLGRHAAWTGSLDLFGELRENVDAALTWLDRYGDTDGDGFVDYRSHIDRGLVNQGWKDSGDGIVNADWLDRGAADRPRRGPGICLSGLARDRGPVRRDPGTRRAPRDLRGKADRIRDRFEDRFWSDRLGCYILALANGNTVRGRHVERRAGALERDRLEGKGRGGRRDACCATTCSADGASGRCRPTPSPSTRSATTSARSGPTTTA